MTFEADETLSPEVEAGQAVYSRRVLAFYDLLVLRFSNRCVWRCPTPRLLELYNEHITANHLEVGVGTGYFLDKAVFPSPGPRLALMDLNPNCLEAAARRVARYQPETLRRNVLQPICYADGRFDSIAVNYVLHCLPGAMSDKAVVFDHLKPLLNAGGVVFGSTLLAEGVRRGWLARRLMRFYNRKGIFANRADSLDALRQALAARFSTSHVETIGCAAIFWAKDEVTGG